MKQILIIDDDPVFRKIYESFFQSQGFLVDCAIDGESAVEKLRGLPPDLILLDLFLRKSNGVQVLRFIRSRLSTHAVPVIVLSNASTSRLVDAAWRAGADRFLSKDDIDPETLLAAVHNVLNAPHPLAPPFNPEPAAQSAPHSLNSRAPLLPPESLDHLVQLQQDLRQTFACQAFQLLGQNEKSLDEFLHGTCPAAQKTWLSHLEKSLASLAGDAGALQFHGLARLSFGLIALIKDLQDEPSYINPSSSQTLCRSIESVRRLLQNTADAEREPAITSKILLVEDESISRWAISAALDMSGLKVIVCDDSRVAESLLQENRFDLILLDWHLPNLNGMELCSRIRHHATNADTPVIIVTARSDVESRVRSSLTGADDYIAKPFLFTELAIRAWLCLLNARPSAKRPLEAAC